MEIETKERVLLSAVWCRHGELLPHNPYSVDKGFVVTGFMHCSCFLIMSLLPRNLVGSKKNHVQGFITNKNRFVDRVEGLAIALLADQIDLSKKFNPKDKLMSEDLFYWGINGTN